jgi:hypothetical protein
MTRSSSCNDQEARFDVFKGCQNHSDFHNNYNLTLALLAFVLSCSPSLKRDLSATSPTKNRRIRCAMTKTLGNDQERVQTACQRWGTFPFTSYNILYTFHLFYCPFSSQVVRRIRIRFKFQWEFRRFVRQRSNRIRSAQASSASAA